MFVEINTNFEEFKNRIQYAYNKSDKELVLQFDANKEDNFDVELVKKYIDKINEIYKDKKIDLKVNYKLSKDFITDTKDCKKLEEIDEYLRKNNNELYVVGKNDTEGYGFRKTLSANRKLDSVANNIKNAKHDGEPLSNYEKFMVAYEYVTEYVYNEGGDVEHLENSHWVPVIEGDKIICGGFSSLLTMLCDRIFSPNEVKVLETYLDVYDKKSGDLLFGHAANMMFIKDDKYGLDGLYYMDASSDSKNDNNKDKSQAYCCLPIKDMIHHKYITPVFRDGLLNLYLSQDKQYIEEKEKINKKNNLSMNNTSVEEDIEKYLLDNGGLSLFTKGPVEKSSAYYKEYVFNNVDLDIGKNNSINESMIEQYKKNIEQKIEKKFQSLFNKCKKIEIPLNGPNKKLTEYYNLEEHLKVLNQPTKNYKEIEDSMKVVANAFRGGKGKEYVERLKSMYMETTTLDAYVKECMVKSVMDKVEEAIKEEQLKQYNEKKKQISQKFLDTLNEKAESKPVPIEAYIRSYKIVGQMKGLKGEQLKQHVLNRIIKSIEQTEKTFDVKHCDSCLATVNKKELLKNDKTM